MVRLSFLEFEDNEGVVEGREMRPEPDCALLEVALLRIEGRFLGAVGAWLIVSF